MSDNKTYAKMDPTLKAQWLKNLRSGEYNQGPDVLRRNDERFCCLGVLCDTINPNGWEPAPGRYRFVGSGEPNEFRTCDFKHHDILDLDAENVLVRMNDSGKSFAEIADWIEENL